MVDNISLPGAGEVVGADLVAGVYYQRVKLAIAADGSTPSDVHGGNPLPITDLMLEIPRGKVTDHAAVNKFGRGTDVDTAACDIWDNTPTTKIWVAPTQARTHQIASTSTDDDGSPVGVGARTVKIWGLTDWDTAETNETVTMDGTTDVPTSNDYVIIHRMQVLTKGATSSNVGTITATADTDATITAQINASEGQTQMAIYGLPSVRRLYITNYYASGVKAAAGLAVSIKLLVNPEPDDEEINFITKSTIGLATDGSNYAERRFAPYMRVDGPAIIKIQGNSSAVNTDVSAGFDAVLRTP